jgi:hypothetical protein
MLLADTTKALKATERAYFDAREREDLLQAQLESTADLLPALKHALDRLNSIPHHYPHTDFALIQNAIKKAEGIA